MSEVVKLIIVLCIWAVICRLGMNLIPYRPWPIGIYAVVCLLAVTWIVPLSMGSKRVANILLKTTMVWWAGTAVIALILVYAVG